MAKHKLTTFRQTDLAMHEYISKFSDLVEHVSTLTPTYPASMILASNFIDSIMNPYIENKLRSCKIATLQDIFKFALEEDQKQKIRDLDFEAKPDTIALCDIQAIRGNNCYKCGNEDHYIKDCPLQNNATHHHNTSPNNKQSHAPHSRSSINNIDMHSPITQTLSNLLDQLKQLSVTNTNSHSTPSYHKSHHNNKDRHKHKYHKRDTKHNSSYNGNKSYNGNTHYRPHHNRHNHSTKVNEIEEFSECSSDCTDLSDGEEHVDSETPETQKLDSPSQGSSNLPVTLRGPLHCSTENRPHASQTVADKNCDNLVLDNPVDKTVYNTDSDETVILHLHGKSADECALMVLLGNRCHKALWDSGAGKCVMSFDCYQSIPTKYKTELYPSRIKMKATNGTFITNKEECDLTFVIGDERFTFPFLCSDQLSKQIILGHNSAKAFHIGTWCDQDDNMYLTRYGKPFEQTIPSSTINALVICTENIVIPPY